MSDFKPDYRGIGKLLRSERVRGAMVQLAEKVKAEFEATAPKDTGQFASSAHIRSTTRGGLKRDRAEATVYNDDPAALSIETGTSDTPEHATLRRALDAI